MGKFKAPTLRNIALTAPYMHDGSIATLGEVVDHYARGGRAGGDSRARSPLLTGFTLTGAEKRDLLEFLDSLTDATFVADPRFANPWAPAAGGQGAAGAVGRGAAGAAGIAGAQACRMAR
jgi:cytochrome c peroxidase